MFTRPRGFTLIELLITVVIISIGVVGIMQLTTVIVTSSSDAAQDKQALLIAEALLEEVESARFTYCVPNDANLESATSAAGCADHTGEIWGPPSGMSRPYPNVNDYVAAPGTATSFTSGDSSGIITDANGDPYFNGTSRTDAAGTNYFGASYKAKVTITAEPSLGPSGATIPSVSGPDLSATNALRISVKVTYGNNKSVTLDGFRTRYAPNTL